MTPQDIPSSAAPPPPPPPRRLVRPTGDRLLAGVASGLGRHFELDPALVRIAFVVLTLLGGSGVLLYVILWLILPSEDAPARIRTDSPTWHKVALGALVLLVLVSIPFSGHGLLFAGPALITLAVIGAFGFLLWRAVGGDGSASLTRVALLILAVFGALLLGLGAGVAAAFGAGTAVAIVVVVLGVALVVGGFLGGARWLIIPAVVMAIPLAVVSAADIDLTGGVGRRDYRPSSMDEVHRSYRLGAGELRLDLRGVDLPAGRTDLDLHVGVGRLELTVPKNVCVQSVVHIGAGEVNRFHAIDNGLDVNVAHRPYPRTNTPVLLVRADVGAGQVQFDHSRSVAWDDDWRQIHSGAGRQAACDE